MDDAPPPCPTLPPTPQPIPPPATQTTSQPVPLPVRPPATQPVPPPAPPLRMLYLYLSGGCNLACRHCWISPAFVPAAPSQTPKTSPAGFLPLAYIETAIAAARPLGLTGVKLTGGEPLLHPQVREIVALAAAAGLSLTLETNGTLIDADLANFLAGHGVGFISVSLDGARAATHEALRRVPGSFERAVAGIRALVAAGLRPQVICTLHQGNQSEISDLLALARELGCASLKFNILQRVGRGERFAADHGLSVAEVIALYRQVEAMPPAGLEVFFDIPPAFHPIRRLLDETLSRCAILNILGVLAGGELSLCGIGVNVPELVYGHLAHDSLAEVWAAAPGLQELRRLVPGQFEGICGRCIHSDYCLGACVAENYNARGRLNAAHHFCQAAEALGLFPPGRLRPHD